MKYKRWFIPVLVIFSLCASGCCTSRKIIVFIATPAEQHCGVKARASSFPPQCLPMNRVDSLFMEVEKISKKARIESHEATEHLIP